MTEEKKAAQAAKEQADQPTVKIVDEVSFTYTPEDVQAMADFQAEKTAAVAVATMDATKEMPVPDTSGIDVGVTGDVEDTPLAAEGAGEPPAPPEDGAAAPDEAPEEGKEPKWIIPVVIVGAIALALIGCACFGLFSPQQEEPAAEDAPALASTSPEPDKSEEDEKAQAKAEAGAKAEAEDEAAAEEEAQAKAVDEAAEAASGVEEAGVAADSAKEEPPAASSGSSSSSSSSKESASSGSSSSSGKSSGSSTSSGSSSSGGSSSKGSGSSTSSSSSGSSSSSSSSGKSEAPAHTHTWIEQTSEKYVVDQAESKKRFLFVMNGSVHAEHGSPQAPPWMIINLGIC